MARGATKQVALVTVVLAGIWTGECKGSKIWSWDYWVITFEHWQSCGSLSPLPDAAKAVSNEVEWQTSSCQHKRLQPSLPAETTPHFHTGVFTCLRAPSECWGLICFLNLELSQTSQENILRKGKKQATNATRLLCLLFPLRNWVFLRTLMGLPPRSGPLNGMGCNNYLGWTFYCIHLFHSTSIYNQTSLKTPTCTHPLPLIKNKSPTCPFPHTHIQFPYKGKFSFRRREDSDSSPSQVPAFQHSLKNEA